MRKEKSELSCTLGWVSIITGFFIPVLGMIIAVVGLSVKKSKENYTTAVWLNVIGIIVSMISWIVATYWVLAGYV